MSDVRTLNLSDAEDGMVPLNNNPSTSFVSQNQEKNVGEHKDTSMDSTPISDIMGHHHAQETLEPPMMAMDPRMMQQHPTSAVTVPVDKTVNGEKKNPMNLTDDQFQALIVAACTAAAISKPVQEKLASAVPQFLNAQGNRSMVGLASTGLVAAVLFYVARKYV